jgi:hypothetical protein
MNDYFSILAARVTGAADAVRPLLPSRYEPTPNLLVPEDVFDLVESKQEITIPRPARVADVSQSAVPQRDARSSPKVVNKDHTSDRLPEMNLSAQTIVAARIQPSAEDVPEARRQPTDAIKPKAAGKKTVEAKGGDVIPRGTRIPKQPRAAADTISTPPRVRGLEPRPQEASMRAAMYQRPGPFDGIGPRSKESGRVGTRPTPQRAIAAGTGNPPKTGPDVHISIGRIEVHAVHPPAAAPVRSRKTPSIVSLEDYLARRNAMGP